MKNTDFKCQLCSGFKKKSLIEKCIGVLSKLDDQNMCTLLAVEHITFVITNLR